MKKFKDFDFLKWYKKTYHDNCQRKQSSSRLFFLIAPTNFFLLLWFLLIFDQKVRLKLHDQVDLYF